MRYISMTIIIIIIITLKVTTDLQRRTNSLILIYIKFSKLFAEMLGVGKEVYRRTVVGVWWTWNRGLIHCIFLAMWWSYSLYIVGDSLVALLHVLRVREQDGVTVV